MEGFRVRLLARRVAWQAADRINATWERMPVDNSSSRSLAAIRKFASASEHPPLDSPAPHCSGGSEQAIGLIPASGGWTPRAIENLRVLGHGRAAEARLVRVALDPPALRRTAASDPTQRRGAEAAEPTALCVEKVFHPGLLTRLIYRIAFQAPFAYQDNVDAIQACFYRRRVAAAIVQAAIPEARVARPLYVRWDEATRALVLASEYIRGRGVIPAPVDRWKLRRRLATLLGRGERIEPPPAAEIDELVDLMGRLEDLLVQCGLTGSGWQVCKRAMVSTANLLRTDRGYVVVDLESGIPSVLVPRYVLAGLRQGSLPLFDDLDAGQLRRWVVDNRPLLAAGLGEHALGQLEDDVQRLILHTDNWKRSEPAIGRRPWRLLSRDFTARYRQRVLASWSRRRIVDPQHEALLRASSRFFTTMTFVLGLIPGALGRFCQRMWANRGYRDQVRRFCGDAAYRAEASGRYVAAKSHTWRAGGRIGQAMGHRTLDRRFATDWLLSKLSPTLLHRVLVDREYRRDRRVRMFLVCVSGTFQSQFGRMLIQSRIGQWQRASRLTADQADELQRQLDSAAVDEYVRGFGMHVGLKLLMPVMTSLKVGGAAASVASGNPLYFLAMLMLLPMLRTGVTLWRMIASGQPAANYRDALLVGVMPVVGSLAYPVQMYAKFPALSLFLLRDFASRVGCSLPIYGGKDSRTEMLAIAPVDVVAEGLQLWLTVTGSAGRAQGAPAVAAETLASRPASIKIRRWDRLAREQLERMAEEAEFAVHTPASPQANAAGAKLPRKTRQVPRRAA